MACKRELLAASLHRFFLQHPAVLEDMRCIVDKRDAVSLRLLEWFVTSYAPRHAVTVRGPEGDGPRTLVAESHARRLAVFGKELLDVFRRKQRVELGGLSTSVAQLHFFRWAHETGVLRHVRKHRDEIAADMAGLMRARRAARGSAGSAGSAGDRSRRPRSPRSPRRLRPPSRTRDAPRDSPLSRISAARVTLRFQPPA